MQLSRAAALRTHFSCPNGIQTRRHFSVPLSPDVTTDIAPPMLPFATSTQTGVTEETKSVSPIKKKRPTLLKTEKINFLLKPLALFPGCTITVQIQQPKDILMLGQSIEKNNKFWPTLNIWGDKKKERFSAFNHPSVKGQKQKLNFGVLLQTQTKEDFLKVGTLAKVTKIQRVGHSSNSPGVYKVWLTGERRFRIKDPTKTLIGNWQGKATYFDDQITTADIKEQEDALKDKVQRNLTEISNIFPNRNPSNNDKRMVPTFTNEEWSLWMAQSVGKHSRTADLLSATSTLERLSILDEIVSVVATNSQRKRAEKEWIRQNCKKNDITPLATPVSRPVPVDTLEFMQGFDDARYLYTLNPRRRRGSLRK